MKARPMAQSSDPREFHPMWIMLPALAAFTVAALLSVPAVYFGKVYFHELQVQEARSVPPTGPS